MHILSKLSSDFTTCYQKDLTHKDIQNNELIWTIEKIRPFEELIFSWNGKRPKTGKWTFWISVQQTQWSPWIQYAEWSANSQKTFEYAQEGSFIEARQGIVYPKDGECIASRVRILAEDGSDLTELKTLYLCLSSLSKISNTSSIAFLDSIFPSCTFLRPQMQIPPLPAHDLCSPAATSIAINYLLAHQKTDPISFAAKVYDETFDIYGNWILNTAQGYVELGGLFSCFPVRLPSFETLHTYLSKGIPIVASIRGALPGATHPFTFGHLICIVGYNAKEKEILCIDPANPKQDGSVLSYPLRDFIEAWGKRFNLTYLFTHKTTDAMQSLPKQRVLAVSMLNR